LLSSAFNQWNISITDTTTSQSYQATVNYFSSQLSAEWIIERPEVGRTLTMSQLANFGTVNLTNCTTTINGATGGISNFPAAEVVMYSSTTSGSAGNPLTSVSDLGSDGASFAVSYLASG